MNDVMLEQEGRALDKQLDDIMTDLRCEMISYADAEKKIQKYGEGMYLYGKRFAAHQISKAIQDQME